MTIGPLSQRPEGTVPARIEFGTDARASRPREDGVRKQAPTSATPIKAQGQAERIFQHILERLGNDPQSLARLRGLATQTFEHMSESESPVVAALTHAKLQVMLAEHLRRLEGQRVDQTA